MAAVKIYFDLACPFCYLARGFWQKMQAEYPVVAEWVPWEAHPELPPEGKEKNLDATHAGLKKLRSLGEGIRQFELNTRTPNTHNALLGLEFARSKAKLDKYVERFYRAYFVEGRDISLIEDVTDLGAEIGLDKNALTQSIQSKEFEQVLVDHDQQAEKMQLEVVPSFVQDGVLMFEGSQTMNFEEFQEKYHTCWKI